MTKRIVSASCLAGIVLIAIALIMVFSTNIQATAEQPPAAAVVKIDNFAFTPQTLTVSAGTTVTWTNRDDIPHTVVSTDGVFKSKVRDTDETFSFKFEKAGTYSYFCSVHPKMNGKVVVQ